ncbi:MAG: radical SAM protein [Spirochaetaceae bacterium]
MHAGEPRHFAALSSVGRVYVEKGARDYPDTTDILDRLSGVPVQDITHYKDVFNRPGQHFQVQKRAPALILAVERENLLYDGKARVASWGAELPLYYNAPVRNCAFNCDYCFLQGMHNSGNLVVFVNSGDFMSAAAERSTLGPIFLSISYLTDLLAFEPLIPICERWIRFAETNNNLTIEIRTKSDLFRVLRHIPAPRNTVLSFSLSPDKIARKYERGCAPLHGRLLAAREAIRAGWRVRLCIDPVIRTEDWRALYTAFIHEIFSRLPAAQVEEVSFGVVRLAPDFLKRIQIMRHDSDMLYYPFVHESGGDFGDVATYPNEVRTGMKGHVEEELLRYLPREKIHFVHG